MTIDRKGRLSRRASSGHAATVFARNEATPLKPSHPQPIAIAWIHGLFGAPADWDATRAALALALTAAGMPSPQQTTIALPGHADAPGFAGISACDAGDDAGSGFADACAAVDAALLAAGAAEQRWLLCGYSMGGRLAMALAASCTADGRAALGSAAPRAPIAGVVPISAHPGLADAADRATRRAQDFARAARLATLGSEAFLAQWLALPLFAPACARFGAKALIAQRSGIDADAAAATCRALSLGWQPDLGAALAEFAIDGVVAPIAGALDPDYRAVLGALARRCGATLRVVDDAGHVLPLEAPTALARHIVAVLAALAGGGRRP